VKVFIAKVIMSYMAIRKRGFSLIPNTLVGWIIILIVFVLLLVLAGVLFGKGQGAIEYIKNLFSFGR
jgi:hypothetical protein